MRLNLNVVQRLGSSSPTLLNNLNGQIANSPYDDSNIASVGQFCKLSRYSVGGGGRTSELQ